MIVGLFFILIFLVCWFLLFVNWVVAFSTKSKLKKNIKKNHPKIRCNLSVFESDLSTTQIKSGSHSLLKLFLSFGSKKSSKLFWNSLVDTKAVEDSNDNEIKRLLNSSIRLTGNYSKIWIIMMGSILLAALIMTITDK